MTVRRLYPFAIILGLWYLLHLTLHQAIIPSPWAVFTRLMTNLPALLPHFFASLRRILMAIFATMAIGIPAGLFLGRHPLGDRLISPVLLALFPVPKIAFLPVLMLLFGLGDLSKILLIMLVILFQLMLQIKDRVKDIDQAMYYAIQSMGASKVQVYRHVILPAMLPSIFTALRISIGTSLSVLFFAENYAAKYGLGFYIMDSWVRISYVDMFTGIVLLSCLGGGLFYGVHLMERRYCRWTD